MANKELKSIKFPGLADTYTVNSMPDGASANQQLATDKDGVVKWEEKPFYQFRDTEVITWDGDTTGREETPASRGGSFWKISDTIYPPDRIIGRTFTLMNNGVPEDIVITGEIFHDFSSVAPGAWMVYYNSVPAIASSGGLYYLKTDTYYVSSLSLIKTTLKEIDPVYIPEIPAEKLPEIPAEKLPEIPAEKLPSSIHTVEQKTFAGTFDKVTEGRDTFKFNAFNYYKISEFSPSREDVINFSGTRENGNALSIITEGENCCEYGFFIVVYKAGQCELTVSATSYSFNAPSAGLYACYESGNDSQTAGTYNFTCRLMRNIIQNSTTFKRYYLDVDDSGTLTAIEV